MFTTASAMTLAQSARGMRIDSPESFETRRRPSAAKPSVAARKVRGRSSVTPYLITGQLHPQTSARITICSRLDAPTLCRCTTFRAAPSQCSRAFAVLRLVQRPRLGHPLVAHDTARKFGQLRIEVGNIAFGPARDLAEGAHAQVMQHALEHRTDSDNELQVVGLGGSEQYRRRSLVFDIEHELPIARRFTASIGEIVAQSPRFGFQAADDARLLSIDTIVTGAESLRSGSDRDRRGLDGLLRE